jgi:periplasmic protein TonB
MENLDDIIFKNRNHDYGAYHLRKKSATVQIISMTISVIVFFAVFFGFFIYYNLPENSIAEKTYYYDKSTFSNPFQPELKPMVEKQAGKKQLIKAIPEIADDAIIANSDKKEDFNEGQDTASLSDGTGNGGEKGDSLFRSDMNIDDDPTKKYKMTTQIESPPMFPGGESARMIFLQKNITYPAFAQKNNIEGPVCVTFIVEPDSSITHIQILQGIGLGCDEEASRVIRAMPKWIPGIKNGKPIRCQVSMPIIFTLHSL